MKRLIPLLLALPLVLAACGSATQSYRLTYNVDNAAMHTALTVASTNVIVRRLDSLGTTASDQKVQQETGSTILTLTFKDKAVINQLSAQLAEPYKFRLMKEVPATTQTGATVISVKGQGTFAETGITEKDVIWGQAAEDEHKKGAVRITFLPSGQAKLAAVFKENLNKNIGIFVRDRLVSKLIVKTDAVQDAVVIRDIPDVELARVFVDDLNVGLHVTFTPLP